MRLPYRGCSSPFAIRAKKRPLSAVAPRSSGSRAHCEYAFVFATSNRDNDARRTAIHDFSASCRREKAAPRLRKTLRNARPSVTIPPSSQPAKNLRVALGRSSTEAISRYCTAAIRRCKKATSHRTHDVPLASDRVRTCACSRQVWGDASCSRRDHAARVSLPLLGSRA